MSRDRLLALFDRNERERQALLLALDVLPPERLATHPPNGGWTVAQVITHLAIVEERALAYMHKKLEVNSHAPAGVTSDLRLLFLNTAIRLPLKYKAPPVVADVPATSYGIARARWNAVRESMRADYATIDPAFIGHGLFKHPTVGRFSLPQGVSFMREHMLRHAGQIRRTLATLG